MLEGLAALFARADHVLERVTGLPREAIFNPPASESKIAELEACLGCQLPEEIRQAYLWHDGERHHPFERPPGLAGLSLIPPFFVWSSLAEVVRHWESDRSLDGYMMRDPRNLWNTFSDAEEVEAKPCRLRNSDLRWIPIAQDTTDQKVCLDLHPSRWGVEGQIFRYRVECDHFVIATSFTEGLAQVVDALDAERYVRDEAEGDWVSARTGEMPFTLEDLR